MSPLYFTFLQALAVILGLTVLGLMLRLSSVISVNHNQLFAMLVTDLALPALIFTSLARERLAQDELLSAAIMASALVLCIVAAWIIGRALRLEPRTLGAFVLVASVGSSSTLGYALIAQVFPHSPAALSDAVIVSELGVLVPCFVIAIPVAIYFSQSGYTISSAFKDYLQSPLFFSMVLGLAVSTLQLPLDSFAAKILFQMLDVVAGSLAIFVALSVSLMLMPLPLRRVAPLVAGVMIITLMLKPLAAFALSSIAHLPPLDIEILLIEAAMPAGSVAAVLAGRYGCDGATASALVVASYLLSLLTMPLVMLLLG
jgi:predicted permease